MQPVFPSIHWSSESPIQSEIMGSWSLVMCVLFVLQFECHNWIIIFGEMVRMKRRRCVGWCVQRIVTRKIERGNVMVSAKNISVVKMLQSHKICLKFHCSFAFFTTSKKFCNMRLTHQYNKYDPSNVFSSLFPFVM